MEKIQSEKKILAQKTENEFHTHTQFNSIGTNEGNKKNEWNGKNSNKK